MFRCLSKRVRQCFAAALIIGSGFAVAQPVVSLSGNGEYISVDGLTEDELAAIMQEDVQIWLQAATVMDAPSMPLDSRVNSGSLIIEPRYKLLPGRDYKLTVGRTSAPLIDAIVVVHERDAPVPQIKAISPSVDVIPANTLRVYLTFSEAMRRGQVKEMIWLEDESGSHVRSPFLNLSTELWDHGQKRLTLLFDPGRTKQGVGPNIEGGAPLIPDQSVTLVVSGQMKSAAGYPLGHSYRHHYSIADAERRALAPEVWQIESPPAGSQSPLIVSYDRAMDAASAKRLLQVEDANGSRLLGRTISSSRVWTFEPAQVWKAEAYTLVIAPGLEDISGNTIGYPFDASPGTRERNDEVASRRFTPRHKSRQTSIGD